MKPHYKVIKPLGEGSYGKVFLCREETSNLICVIKQIVIEGMNQKEKDEVYNEATILSKLDHQNIIKFLDAFYSYDKKHTLNIVTEYADDGDLSQKIKNQGNKSFTESEILKYFTQICLALKYIHHNKIIHRDLKSGNVFLMKSGGVKLGDFGIAKKCQNTLDKAKTMVGTPYYLSPEILEGKPYDNKSDIWSLGILLYEMMTLKMPFNANSLPMLSVKILRGNYTPPPAIYTADLRDIVSRCLQIVPSRRPSINEILNLPIIKNSIRKYLDDAQYNKEFSKSIAKRYKENKKNQEIKHQENEIQGLNNQENEIPSELIGNSIKKINNLNNNNEKILDFFKKNNLKKENKEKEKEKKREGFHNFLAIARKSKKWGDQNQFNENGVMWGKNQDNQIQIKSKEESEVNNINDIENYDMDKITEDQYNEARYLNELNNIVNEEKDSDEENNHININNKVIQTNENKIIFDEGSDFVNQKEKGESQKEEKNDNRDSDDEEFYFSKFREIELMRKNLEKILGLKLLIDSYHLIDDAIDRRDNKFEKEKIINIMSNSLRDKGFSETEISSAIEQISEIYNIIMKERNIIQ